tara:strand:- start:314 stop:994 length:681 start_codon:yes stop_codon:yes gene_type:complete
MAEPRFTPYTSNEEQAPVVGPENLEFADTPISTERTEGLPVSHKKPFGEKQGLAGGFAVTMENAANIINRIEDKEGGFLGAFGPTGWWDNQLDASFDSDIWERFLMSSDYKLYDQERRRWMMAQLRWESGAAIPPEEIESGLLAYFPQPGNDSREQILAKREARRLAMSAMKTFGGEAYKEAKRDAYNRTPTEEAVLEIKQRAKESKEFEAEAIKRGVLSKNWRNE